MGNGSVKTKPVKSPNGPHGSSGRGKGFHSHRDPSGGLGSKSTAQHLKAKVEELEQELRRRDEELDSRRLQMRCLQEQLLHQGRVIGELTEQLQAHSLQLGQLQAGPQPPTPPRARHDSLRAALDRRRGAKAGVSAEPSSRTYDSGSLPQFSLEKARVWKEASVKKQITDSLNKNLYLRKLEAQQIRDMVECMYERSFQQGDYAIKQGEPGNHLFVLADGSLEVYQHSQLLSSIPVWSTFGELALLYNCTRTASVRAVTCVKTWALDREVFHNIMRMTAETRHEQHRNFLRSVSLLANLPEDKLSKIVDCLEVEYYDKGDHIIREGEEGNTFYIISKGKVKVTQSTEDHAEPQVINTLQRGDYFGEKALISDDVRSANIIADEDGVECLVIDRETFNQTVGTFSELQKYLQGYVETLDRDDKKRHAKKLSSTLPSPPLSPGLIELTETETNPGSAPRLSSLEVITTLGVGGFGRVELVKVKNEEVTFALKRIKKAHVVENKQEEHIHSERRILTEADSPFIIKLHRTYRDNKYVYMLLEACLGGEIWSLLRDRGSFDEHTARFCVGCVTEAFDYLHHKGIIYRDLKPENLMLDADGYIKLVDFGFAKKMKCGQKTWTFCGTPEYVAPEIILNKGHSFSVDFWSLGILVFEILTGSPPFSGTDQMITYTFILRGIESLDFPKRITKRPADLIRKLCRQNPSERLGNLKNGITDIKKHRWFSGFSWSGLKNRTLKSPLKRELTGTTDHSYFDTYPPDEDTPPDELSGWDMDF
ncbi:cGMP-dependent protein kinase 2 [Clupea harengus]|uniref:cGMP-dependent protein kinase n=1 Tax=Clupea harengus TaxID=7950 RepID=A0A6P8FDL1_CLUHA|nr:cGMP-dependent protein kinase 2 [Clupea harengus]XP_042564208.1 cGMP-dependent protein kinase 2 [Clupea harengus]